MITLMTTNEIDFELAKEALTNHGFEFKTSTMRKMIFFGVRTYWIKLVFSPKVSFLEVLLRQAETQEDYYIASSIKRMIDIKKQ
jgi:hypothetical protein